MITKRSKASLAQLLALQDRGFARVLLQKHGIGEQHVDWQSGAPVEAILEALAAAQPPEVWQVLEEVFRTEGDLRNRVSPRYRYDERRQDLLRCLLLDGYRLENQQLVTIAPTVQAATAVEDDLVVLLRESGLPDAPQILALLERSADDFRKVPPDFNGCLANARIALETLAKGIANARRAAVPGPSDDSKWGAVLAYLRNSGFITEDEEAGLVGVYRFVSRGAHKPMVSNQEEIVRLGRGLIMGMSYFLAKLYRSP